MNAPATKAARSAAKGLIRKYNLSRPVDVVGLAKKLDYSVRFESFENTLSGLYVAKHRVIAVNKLHPQARQRFTIAHEIGHAILHTHDGVTLFLDESPIHLRDASGPIDAREIEANRFAAELLMPEDEVRALVNRNVELYEEDIVAPLAREFVVSSQAFTARLVELGLVSRSTILRNSK